MAYAGEIAPIIAGQGGFNGSQNYDQIPVTDLIECKHIRFDNGTWTRAGGFAYYDSAAVTGAPTCLGGIDYWSNSSTQQQVTAWNTGIVYKSSSTNLDAVELVNSLSLNAAPAIFVPSGEEVTGNNKKLLMFSQGVVPQVLNAAGVTMANLAYPSIDWSGANQPMAAVPHDRRLVAWGNQNARHALYFSAIDNHENFLRYDPANISSELLPSIDINPGEGDEIRGAISMGTTRLFVFKYPAGIYFVDTTSITSYFTPVTTVRTDIGLAGPAAITKVGGLGTWFIGADGHIYSLEMISNPDIDPLDASITAKMQLNKWINDNVNLTRAKWFRLIYDNSRKEVWAIYSSSSATSNDLALIIDVRDPSNPKVSVDQRGNFYNAAWVSRNSATQKQNLLLAGTSGRSYVANDDDNVIGTSTPYTSTLRIPDTDFSWYNSKLGSYSKRFDWFELVYNGVATSTLNIDTYIDGIYYKTYTTTIGTDQYTLGVGSANPFILGTATLYAAGISKKKIKIGGLGKRFGFRLRSNNINDDFNVSRIFVHFSPQDTLGEN